MTDPKSESETKEVCPSCGGPSGWDHRGCYVPSSLGQESAEGKPFKFPLSVERVSNPALDYRTEWVVLGARDGMISGRERIAAFTDVDKANFLCDALEVYAGRVAAPVRQAEQERWEKLKAWISKQYPCMAEKEHVLEKMAELEEAGK